MATFGLGKLFSKAATPAVESGAGMLARRAPTIAKFDADAVVNKAIDDVLNAAPAKPVAQAAAPIPPAPASKSLMAPKKALPEAVPYTEYAKASDIPTPAPKSVIPDELLEDSKAVPNNKLNDFAEDDGTVVKPFTEEQLSVGEKKLGKKYYFELKDDPNYLSFYKMIDPYKYAEELHAATAKELKLTPEETPKFKYEPAESKANVAADNTVVEEVEYDDYGYPIVGTKEKPVVGVAPSDGLGGSKLPSAKQYLIGDLNNKAIVSSMTKNRNQALQAIKEDRTDAFNILKNEPLLKDRKGRYTPSIDDDVIGVVQGEYRYTKGKELDPTDPKQLKEFADMAQVYQKKLDVLRDKYSNVPPIDLYHGTMMTSSRDRLVQNGFNNPQLGTNTHAELTVAAPSFTKDVNMNMADTSFGGTDPSHYIYTAMPYADYVFKRVNINLEKKEASDLNEIARTITGSPTTARPLSLPRGGGYMETEDVFVEADKLAIKSAEEKMARNINVYKDRQSTISFIQGKLEKYLNSFEDYGMTVSARDARIADTSKASIIVEANQAYNALKSLLRSTADYSKKEVEGAESAWPTSTKQGIGQRYQANLRNLTHSPSFDYFDALKSLAKELERAGSKEKAANVTELAKELRIISYRSKAEDKERTKAATKMLSLTDKLAKGGLVSRRPK